MDEVYVAGKIFRSIKTDDRVTSSLQTCLYCKVTQSGVTDNKNWFKDIDYQIPLDCINGSAYKQCPACKTIYILKDILE